MPTKKPTPPSVQKRVGKARKTPATCTLISRYMCIHTYIHNIQVCRYVCVGGALTHFVAPTNRCVNHVSIAYFCNEFWNISGIFSLKSGQKKACGGESRRRKREGSAEPSDMTLLLKLVHLSSFFPLSSWLVFSPPTQHHFQPAFTALSSHISGPLWGALVMRVHVKHFRVSATKTFFGFRFCSKKKKQKQKKFCPTYFAVF